MWFWIKHLSAALVLLGLAFVLLVKPELINFNPDAAAEQKKPTKSSAAKEFTNFYEQLRYSLDATADSSKEYVIKLKDTSDKLTSTLVSRTNTVPPLAGNWQGSVTNRQFTTGSKVRDQMAGFANDEGIELIWTLPRDYVVKHYFESGGDYLSSLNDIVSAIAPDFETPVLAYFCPRERAAIVTDKPNQFLEENCRLINGEKQKLRALPSAN
jgi:hypothetical protein